jgi:hypothetical protein
MPLALYTRAVSGVIDHVGIRVSDLPASRRMYEAALAELGLVVLSCPKESSRAMHTSSSGAAKVTTSPCTASAACPVATV